MNDYRFEYEINNDGWLVNFITRSTNKLAAYEDFIVFLREYNIDPATVDVVNCWVSECDDEEEEE